MILVVGATGALGSEICRVLRARNMAVRALVRPGSPGETALRDIGVDIATGDLRSPATVAAACRGARAVISTATAMGTSDKTLTLRAIDHDGQLQLVDAAKNNGVERFVFVSVSPHLRANAPLVRYKRAVEAAVRSSGMAWTILQPTLFMEIWLSKKVGFDVAARRVSTAGTGDAPLGWICIADVARHAMLALEDPRLSNRDVPLAGPSMVTFNDVVAEFETASGHAFTTKHVPRAVLAILSPVVAAFNEMAASGMSLMAQTALGDRMDLSLQRELGLPLTSVRQYAERVTNVQREMQ